VVGILLTGSRGGFIGTAAGLAAFGLLSLISAVKLAPSRALVFIVAGSLMCVLVGWGVRHIISESSMLQARLGQKVDGTDSRVALWHAAWEQFKLQPLTGTGSGTYLYYGRQFRNRSVQSDPVHAHNEYLELLAEYGILGMTLALLFIGEHLRNGWNACAREGSGRWDSLSTGSNSLALTVGAFGAAVACAAHSLVDYTLHMPANMLLMSFVFAVLANPNSESQVSFKSAPSRSNSFHFFRWVLPGLGLVIAVRVLPIWPAEYYADRARALLDERQYGQSKEDALTLENLARRGLAWDPRHPALYSYLGEAQSQLAEQSTSPSTEKDLLASSLAAYQKAVELAPNDAFGILALASTLDDLERFSESEPLFEKASRLDPNSLFTRYAYARHLHKMGKLAEAEVQYRKSLELGSSPFATSELERLTKELQNSGKTSPPRSP
jgi:tetratricopeptide (TPR) repeat protein